MLDDKLMDPFVFTAECVQHSLSMSDIVIKLVKIGIGKLQCIAYVDCF